MSKKTTTEKVKNIIILWGDNTFWDGTPGVKVCKSPKDLKKLSKDELKEAKGFVVQCELPWDHEAEKAGGESLSGISLVQHYLRTQKRVKAPVVFVSFDNADHFKDKQGIDTRILFTPALQHKFVQFSGNPDAVLEAFNNMEYMTDRDLAYTQSFYCNAKGMLDSIIHGISSQPASRSITQINYILRQEFPNNNELTDRLDEIAGMEEDNKIEKLKEFCQDLRNKWSSIPSDQTDIQEETQQDIKDIQILYIEDNIKSGHERRFHKFMSNPIHQREYHFQYEYKNSPDGLIIPNKGGKPINNFLDYDVIICDIELNDETTGELRYLGYKEIEKLAKISLKPLYYLVTNMSRSVYDQIKIPGVRRIRLKEEIFGTEDKIKAFLHSIKGALEDRESLSTITKKYQLLFSQLDSHVRTNSLKVSNYPFTDIDGNTTTLNLTFEKYEDFNRFVQDEAKKVILYFLKVIDNNLGFSQKGTHWTNFIRYDKCCKQMREQIRETITLGNENLENILKQTRDPDTKDVMNFAVRMILRRFCLYVHNFVHYWKIDDSFGLKPDKKGCFNPLSLRGKLKEVGSSDSKDGSFSNWDLACRAISSQYKMLNPSLYEQSDNPDGLALRRTNSDGTNDLQYFENNPFEVILKTDPKTGRYKHNGQTHCMDVTLLWSEKLIGEGALTEEEKAFWNAIDCEKFKEKFLYSKNARKKLSTSLFDDH